MILETCTIDELKKAVEEKTANIKRLAAEKKEEELEDSDTVSE